MSGANNEDAMFQTLLSYKKIALDPMKHHIMMKDKTIIQFLAYSLDSEDEEIVETALQTMELLVRNTKNQNVIRSTFGIIEALKSTSERSDLSLNLRDSSKNLSKCLEAPGPAYCTRSRSKATLASEAPKPSTEKISSSAYTFLIFGLNSETRGDLETILIRIKGVISVLVDVDHQRCVVRAVQNVTPEIIAESIASKTNMEAHLVVHNKNNQEVLKDVLNKEKELEEEVCKEELPPYLAEEESPVKEKALLTLDQLRTSATSLIRTAAEFFQNSFYW